MTKICPICKVEFDNVYGNPGITKKGNLQTCSSVCAGLHRYRNTPQTARACKTCGITFFSNVQHTKYCSPVCKTKAINNRRKKHRNKDTRIRTPVSRLLKSLPCQICGWTESTRDIHHILPVSLGGLNTLDNLIVVCPNHHRMIHNKLISKEDIHNYRVLNTPQYIVDEINLLRNSTTGFMPKNIR